MGPAFSITFLLLAATCAAVVNSLEVQSEEEDFPPQFTQEIVGHQAEEIPEDGGAQDVCDSCKTLVKKVKKEMGEDASKAKVAKLVNKVCSRDNDEKLKAACKKMEDEKKIKDQLSAAIAGGGEPKSVCEKVRLCE